MTAAGASPESWAHWDLILGVSEDLLPVVADLSVKVSPLSGMKALGKTPSLINRGGFAAGIPGWTSHRASAEDIAKWSADPRLGICLQTRSIRALDCDINDELFAKEIHNAIDTFLGQALPARCRADAFKFLLAFRMPGEYPKRTIKTKHGIIEFLGTGQQAVVDSTHPGGARYEWVGGLPVVIPELAADLFEGLWASLTKQFALDGGSTTSSLSTRKNTLEKAVLNDPVAQSLFDKGLVRSTGQDNRLHITCPFEAEHTSDSADSATTYFPAFTGGYERGNFLCLHAHCSERKSGEFLAALGLTEDPADDFEAVIADPDTGELSGMRFAFIDHGEFSTGEPMGWIIKGVLPRGELGMIFGPPASGKSFLALDMALAIAQGLPWCGKKVHKTAVGYIAAEGASGFRGRITAYANRTPIADDATFKVLAAVPNLMTKADVVDLGNAVAKAGLKLLFYDTLARGTAGADENSAKDMGVAIANCRAIHDHTGAMVILIHHSGKDPGRGARGSNAHLGAVDVEIEVTRSDNNRIATISKLKEGEDGAQFGFKLITVPIGMDEDGDVISSCVIEYGDVVRAKEKVKPMRENETHVWNAALECQTLDGNLPSFDTVIQAAVAKVVYELGSGKDRRAEAMRTAFAALERRGKLLVVGGGVSIVDNKEQ